MTIRLNMLKSKHILQEKRAECVVKESPVVYKNSVTR